MNITVATCKLQAEAWLALAESSPVSVIARPARLKAKEWERAAHDLTAALEQYGTAEIEMAGALEPGCRVVHGSAEADLIRVLEQGSRVSLHLSEPTTNREHYVNLWGGRTSPVVIL